MAIGKRLAITEKCLGVSPVENCLNFSAGTGSSILASCSGDRRICLIWETARLYSPITRPAWTTEYTKAATKNQQDLIIGLLSLDLPQGGNCRRDGWVTTENDNFGFSVKIRHHYSLPLGDWSSSDKLSQFASSIPISS